MLIKIGDFPDKLRDNQMLSQRISKQEIDAQSYIQV